MISRISSVHNPKIKRILQLNKTSKRKEENLFIIEGFREIERAYRCGYSIEQIYFCPEIANAEVTGWISEQADRLEIYEVDKKVYSKITYRENVDGLLVTARTRDHGIEKLITGKDPLILVLESVEKPGNLGAALRTADAAGADAIIVCDPLTDIYNPNVIRSSLGCVFSVQIAVTDTDSAIRYLTEKHIKIFASILQEARTYTDVDYRYPTAIILGSEAAGLSQSWREAADTAIKIPMYGIADSLNVSVSAAILIFEALRQRKT